MSLYYQDELVTLYHGNCTEIPEWTAAGVLVTDPPYGMAYVSNASKSGPSKAIEGDETTELRDRVLEIWGPDKPALVFGTWRVDRPRGTRQLLVWDKGDSPGMGDLKLPWGPSHEEVYVLGAQNAFIGKRGGSVIRIEMLHAGAAYRPNHPTPKPVALMEWLLARCPKDRVIADPFAGSGATLLAARNVGLPSIGVECEEKYCELIASRLSQDVLFSFGEAA